jgi:hypothetical protein
MKKTKGIYNQYPNESFLILKLYEMCSKEQLQLTKDNESLMMPVFVECPELVMHYDAVPNAVIPFNPAIDTVNLEAFGLYVRMDNIQMHMPEVVINSKNIELCARHYIQSKFSVSPKHPSFPVLLRRTIEHMKAIAKVYFTSHWILEHAVIRGKACFGVPSERTFENLTFKKTVALWMTFNVVKDYVGINGIMRSIIEKNKCFPSLLKSLMADRSAGFQALKQCIVWGTYSVEILNLLCREYVNKENSLLLENPLEFWMPFTISRYDNRTSEYLSEEIKRIITKFYPKLVNRLPFLFDGSGLERWN